QLCLARRLQAYKCARGARWPSGLRCRGLRGPTGIGKQARGDSKRRHINVRVAWSYGNDRSAGPAHFQTEVVEYRTGPSFKNKTIGGKAAKEDSAFGSIEGKEIGPPQEIGPHVILQFEHLAVGAEKAGRIGVAVQAKFKQQKSPLVFFVFKQGITVGRPCRGKIGGAVL